MKYTHPDYIRLMSAVEEQGGVVLDETCAKDELTYKMPDGKTARVYTHGCENETLLAVPYEAGAAVTVPTPVLEVDPKRGTYRTLSGETRDTTRSVKSEDPETGEQRVVFEMVEHDAEAARYPEKVRVCAVADNVGMWPRFAGTIQDKGSM